MPPQLIFGTAAFGMDMTEFQDTESVSILLQKLQELGINRLDTGARYPPLNHGRSETLIGASKSISKTFVVDTKVFTDTRTDGSGDLKQKSIQGSIDGSLHRLQRPDGVNVLYAHRADPTTPLDEQIRGFNEQIDDGRCKAWGVSNTPPEVLERIVQLCDQNGWKKPSCYQGSYNLITRGMETRLLPILRAHGISFIAYQAFAAGFLTGKSINNQQAGTRFDENNPLGNVMQKMFGAVELQQAMQDFDARVKLQGLTPLEVAIRWIAHHSSLSDQDGIILGASKTTQVSEAVALMHKGPLPDALISSVEGLWDTVRVARGDII